MHARLPRHLRLGLPVVAVLALGLAGCAEPAAPRPAAPALSPTSSSPAPSAATPSGAIPSGAIPSGVGTTGSDGLTVRYLGADGSVKTVRVEDFPR